jgi:pimeloyl-ACP methyl ester carboxylesterase
MPKSSSRRYLEEDFQASSSLPLWREALLGMDWVSLRMSAVYRGIGVPKGDKSAVIVVPGFMGSDQYLGDMHAWLKRIGYTPYLSGIGRNAECPDYLTARLHETIEAARKESGKKVHLIGHSLGGVLARSAARRWPQSVASCTTMASPFRGIRVHPFVLQTAYLVRGRIMTQTTDDAAPHCYSGYCTCEFLASLRDEFPASVPQQAIYTKTDGVVDWRCCINDEPETNLEVPGTHVGLAFNPQVYRHIANFLGAAQGKPQAKRRKSAA